MLAAVSFGVGITTVIMKHNTSLLTGLLLLTVCHKLLCTQGSMSPIIYTVCVRMVLRHSILTCALYARYCVIQSLHKLCTQSIASFNPYTSCVRKVLHHPILTQVVYARYCVIQSLHNLCTQGTASSSPYTSCVRKVLRHSILTQVFLH
jgi:hypothetical protein